MAMSQVNLLEVPSFIYVGAQRSGSTWLYKSLSQHPQIFLPPMKEVHYFDKLDNTLEGYNISLEKPIKRNVLCRLIASSFILGILDKRNLFEDMSFWWNYIKMDGSIEWYKSLFKKATDDGKITGDITPAYSTLTEQSIQKLRSLNSNLKLIFILRNPIDRSYSQVARRLFAQRGSNISDVSNQEIIDFLSSENCLSRSDYLSTLERYEKFFSPEDIFIGFFEEVKACPHDLLTRICNFIGAEPIDESQVIKEPNNPSSHLLGKIHPEILEFLVELHSANIEKMSYRFGGYAKEWHQKLIDYRST